MAELIKATNITKVRIEDEIGKETRVRAMLRTYVMPGFYILNRHKHGPSPTGRLWAAIQQFDGKGSWRIIAHRGGDLALHDECQWHGSANSLAEAVQVALLELHK